MPNTCTDANLGQTATFKLCNPCLSVGSALKAKISPILYIGVVHPENASIRSFQADVGRITRISLRGLEQMGLVCISSHVRRGNKRLRIYQLDPVVYQQQLEILARRKASREKATGDGTPAPTNQLTGSGCTTAEPSYTSDLELWRYGASLSPWVIEDEVGALVMIRDSSRVTLFVSRAELVLWDG